MAALGRVFDRAGIGVLVPLTVVCAAYAPLVFTAAYGTAWVLGSIVIGVLTSASAGGLVAFCVAAELAAIPLLLVVRSRTAAIG